MTSPLTPATIPSGDTDAGSPFTPGTVPGSGGGGVSAAGASAGTVSSVMDIAGAGVAGAWNSPIASHAPTANLAMLTPFTLATDQTVQGFGWFNGSVASGNVDVGIYNEDGTRVVAKGSTPQAGTNTIQTVSITATPLTAGSYFLALVIDNTTGRLDGGVTLHQYLEASGCKQVAASFPLGASLTFAAPSVDIYPVVFASFVSVF